MSKANGQVRPAWMGGSVGSSVESGQEQEVDAAPAPEPADEATPEEVHADHGRDEEGADDAQQTPVEQEPPPQSGPDHSRRLSTPISQEPHPNGDHDGHAHSGACDGLSFGKKDVDEAAHEETAYPYRGSSRSGSGAPAQLKAAISSFMERISGKPLAPSSASAPGGAEAAEPTRREPPEQVEKRLKVSLRETTIEGFRRIAFGSPKGGVGKSSLAYTVAGAIASMTNLRVCLVDADPNFGATRYLVPRPVEQSVLDLADDADRLERLADLRTYVSQNEQMGLDILLNPVEAAQISGVDDLAEAYARVDAVLSRFYDLVIYDLGLGFRDEAIRGVLGLSDELVLISDAEVIPNAQLPDALRYVEGLGVNLAKTTLTINHGRPPEHESARATEVRSEFAGYVRRVTEVPYDATLSRLLNSRAFHIDCLALPARLGVLTTAAAALEGLRRDAWTTGYEKVLSLHPDKANDRANNARGGR